jgi:hypothetical protein
MSTRIQTVIAAARLRETVEHPNRGKAEAERIASGSAGGRDKGRRTEDRIPPAGTALRSSAFPVSLRS